MGFTDTSMFPSAGSQTDGFTNNQYFLEPGTSELEEFFCNIETQTEDPYCENDSSSLTNSFTQTTLSDLKQPESVRALLSSSTSDEVYNTQTQTDFSQFW